MPWDSKQSYDTASSLVVKGCLDLRCSCPGFRSKEEVASRPPCWEVRWCSRNERRQSCFVRQHRNCSMGLSRLKMEHSQNGAFSKWSILKMERSQNGAVSKWSGLKMERSQNGAFSKWSILKMEHSQNGAFSKLSGHARTRMRGDLSVRGYPVVPFGRWHRTVVAIPFIGSSLPAPRKLRTWVSAPSSCWRDRPRRMRNLSSLVFARQASTRSRVTGVLGVTHVQPSADIVHTTSGRRK
jgi:hypothetical protein